MIKKLALSLAAALALLSSASLAREATDVLLPAAFAGEWCRTDNELDSPYGPEWKRKHQARPCRYPDRLTITRTRFSGVMEGQATNCIVTGKDKEDWWTFTCDGKPNLRNVLRLSKGRLYTLGQMLAEYEGSAALAREAMPLPKARPVQDQNWNEDFRRCSISKDSGVIISVISYPVVEFAFADSQEKISSMKIDGTVLPLQPGEAYDYSIGSAKSVLPLLANGKRLQVFVEGQTAPAVDLDIGNGKKAVSFLNQCNKYWESWHRRHPA
jgi:hypothetical protein